MSELDELEKLLRRLADERDSLREHGYEFPALYDAIEYLLREQMPC